MLPNAYLLEDVGYKPPSNIKRRGTAVVSIEVYTGRRWFKRGRGRRGMLLVSGVVESSVGPIFKRSQAKILARTGS